MLKYEEEKKEKDFHKTNINEMYYKHNQNNNVENEDRRGNGGMKWTNSCRREI